MTHELQKRKTVYHPVDRLIELGCCPIAVEQEAVLGGSISLEKIPCSRKNSGDNDVRSEKENYFIKKNFEQLLYVL